MAVRNARRESRGQAASRWTARRAAPAPGWVPAPDEVQPLHVLADVVRAEPRALRQDRLELERAARDRHRARVSKSSGVMMRCVTMCRRRSGQSVGNFQRGQDRVRVTFLHRSQSDFAPQIRHGREHVEAFAAGRGQARVGPRRRVQIEREIVREDLAVENILQQLFVASRRGRWCGAPDPGRSGPCRNRRRTAPSSSASAPAGGRSTCGDAAGRRACGRCWPRRRWKRRPPRETPARPPAARRSPRRPVHRDFIDPRVQVQRPAHLGEQPQQPIHDRARAAHRKMHAPFALQVMDHRVDRTRLERIAADQQRMKAEHLPQMLGL